MCVIIFLLLLGQQQEQVGRGPQDGQPGSRAAATLEGNNCALTQLPGNDNKGASKGNALKERQGSGRERGG